MLASRLSVMNQIKQITRPLSFMGAKNKYLNLDTEWWLLEAEKKPSFILKHQCGETNS